MIMEMTEVHEQRKEKKKIHFAIPSAAPTQLDPRQVEMIRRRRPTPATLFRVADQPSPEDDYTMGQWVVGENGILKPKWVNPNVYQPPPLKAVQQMAEAHMHRLGVYPHLEEDAEQDESLIKCTAVSQEETSEKSSQHPNDERTEEEDEEEQKHGATDG